MVQVINLGPSKTALQSDMLQATLGKGLNEGLGNLTKQLFMNKKMTELENDKELMKKPLSERLGAAQRALAPWGEEGERYYKNRLQIEQQQQQEKANSALSKILAGKEVSDKEMQQLPQEAQFKLAQLQQNNQVANRIEKDLKEIGVEEGTAKNWANLYKDATPGAKTQILNHVLDMQKRGLVGNPNENIENEALEDLGNVKDAEEGFKWPKIEPEKGFTPGEQAKTNREREKTNIPFYNQAVQKSKALKDEGLLLDRLEQLNPQMPTGMLGKSNIDWDTGNLRYPAGSSPEVQLYVKTINEFTKNAKDTFGSRVTNFDLAQFLKRLPTLANSPEGREIIIKQMQMINQLNRLDSDSMKEVYNKYGVGKINHQQATKIADDLKGEKEKVLLDRYKDLDGILKKVDQQIEPKENKPPEGTIQMLAPNGRKMNVPEDKVAEMEAKGAKRG